jgi:hypothetical protein
MARFATPTILFTDFYRAHFKSFDGKARGPNGEDASNYGETGAQISEKYLTILDVPLSPIESPLVKKLMNPFIHFCCRPIRNLATRIKRRGGGSHSVADQRVVNFAVISAIARIIVCLLANVCLAAAIGTLNSKDGSTIRIIIMSVIGLVFALSVSSLGREAIPIYTLITA